MSYEMRKTKRVKEKENQRKLTERRRKRETSLL